MRLKTENSPEVRLCGASALIMSEIQTRLEEIENGALATIARTTDLTELDNQRRALFGKKGELTALLRGMGGVSPEERPRLGTLLNDAK